MTSAKKKNAMPADKLDLYERVIATHPEIERKGDANAYTSVNGNMFTLMGSSGVMALRLPEGEREKFLKKYNASLYEAYGTVMKEYVAVPESLLKNTKELKKYLAMSYDYVKALKPKPTTKKH